MASLAATRKAGGAWLMRWKRKETWLFYLCIAPWLLGFLIWTAGPMIYSLYLSFTSWDLFTPPLWVGFDNYKDIFTSNPDFWQSLKVTAIYTLLSVPLSMIGALGIALLLITAVAIVDTVNCIAGRGCGHRRPRQAHRL